MSKGFLIFAQNNNDIDYVRQAYALALSIKSSQPTINSVSLITNSKVPKNYQKVFDQIIPIPWLEENNNDPLAAGHRWKIYHASPYDETISLEADMLLLEDISRWWDYCSNYDLKFCSKVRNYKLEHITHDEFHRKTFIENSLTNPYFALHYFKKRPVTHDFYKILEFVVNNWEWCWGVFTPKARQDWLSMDLATAIAIEIAGLQEQVIDKLSPLEFIHMKPPLQVWDPIPAKWQSTVLSMLSSKGDLIVGNIKQHKLFHYVEKDFITDSLLSTLEELNNGT